MTDHAAAIAAADTDAELRRALEALEDTIDAIAAGNDERRAMLRDAGVELVGEYETLQPSQLRPPRLRDDGA